MARDVSRFFWCLTTGLHRWESFVLCGLVHWFESFFLPVRLASVLMIYFFFVVEGGCVVRLLQRLSLGPSLRFHLRAKSKLVVDSLVLGQGSWLLRASWRGEAT